jgi:nitrile hydratase accessory protein
MTTLRDSNLTIESDRLSELPRLPRDEGGPVFAEPWQAQAFALAVKLSEQGHYTWKEWATALAEQLQAAADRGEPDDGSRYYEHWLAALETLVVSKGLADSTALLSRKEAWAAAYRNTPHGYPVELQSRAPDARWLLVGLACTFAMYWVFRQAIVEPAGLAASAGLGMLLGMRHSLEPDHLAAVTTLMTGERGSAKAAWLGACWGLGHTVTLFIAGALLVVLQTEMPASAAQLLQGGVIVLLIGFGARSIYQGAFKDRAVPTHIHRTPGISSRFEVDRWTLARPFLVGAVHGLAGSGALIAMLATTLPSSTGRLGYLLLFGVGSTVAMALLSGILGWPLARLGAHHVFVRTFSLIVGGVSIALGVFWSYPFVAQWL